MAVGGRSLRGELWARKRYVVAMLAVGRVEVVQREGLRRRRVQGVEVVVDFEEGGWVANGVDLSERRDI